MKKKHNLKTGDRFSYLEFTGRRLNKDKRWFGEFKCDCGNVVEIRIDGVIHGNNKSCGCKSPNRGYKEMEKSWGGDYPFRVLWKRFQTNAVKRRIEFTITPQDIKEVWLKQNGKCLYTDIDLTMPRNFIVIRDKDVASIDRIDSRLGYVPGNIQLVYKDVNIMKQSLAHEEFIAICTEIADRFPKEKNCEN